MMAIAKLGACAAALAMTLGVAARSESPELPALRMLQPGLWSVESRTADGPATKQHCLGDPTLLLQLAHPRQPCRRFVVSSEAGAAIVTYSCGPRNSGRTAIRVETPRLVQIDVQGFVDGMPYEWALEARRTGECRPAGHAR